MARLPWMKKYNFNPHLHERGDKVVDKIADMSNYFNPRLREGGDFSISNQFTRTTFISIHTSKKGATQVSTVTVF